MKLLTVGFSKPKKFKLFSWIIQKVDNTPFSHVFIRWHSEFLERDIIYQASKMAVNFEEGSNFDAHAETVASFTIALSDEAYKRVVQFMMDNSNKPYSIKQILGIGLIKAAKLAGHKINNPFADGRSAYICDELVAQILIDLDLIEVSEDLDSITPGDLYEILLKTLDTKPT